MALGDDLQAITKSLLSDPDIGTTYTVRSTVTGLTRTIRAKAQDVDPGSDFLNVEGATNVDVKDLMVFRIAGDETLSEVTDEVSYAGWWMRVLAVHGSPMGGTVAGWRALTKRERPVT